MKTRPPPAEEVPQGLTRGRTPPDASVRPGPAPLPQPSGVAWPECRCSGCPQGLCRGGGLMAGACPSGQARTPEKQGQTRAGRQQGPQRMETAAQGLRGGRAGALRARPAGLPEQGGRRSGARRGSGETVQLTRQGTPLLARPHPYPRGHARPHKPCPTREARPARTSHAPTHEAAPRSCPLHLGAAPGQSSKQPEAK